MFSARGVAFPADGAVLSGRTDGGRIIVALPPTELFAERIDLPPRATQGIVTGQLDIRLPVPVEDCLVLTGARMETGPSSVMAYAVTETSFRSFLEDFESRFGFPPERVVPAAEVLWRKLSVSLPSDAGCSLHLHAGGKNWILLAGDRNGLAATVLVTPGDVAGAARNGAILALRLKKRIVSFTLSGCGADDALAQAIDEASHGSSCRSRIVEAPGDFLAMALAEEGALRDLSPLGNFRDDSFPHKGRQRRLLVRAFAAGGVLLAFGLCLFLCAWGEKARARKGLERAENDLTEVACQLAGFRLPVTGAAALEMAANEFDQRLNPVVETLGDSRALDSAVLPLELAMTRNLTFSSIKLDGRSLRLAGKALSEDDLALWRRRAQDAGILLAIESEAAEDGAGLLFTATQIPQEATR